MQHLAKDKTLPAPQTGTKHPGQNKPSVHKGTSPAQAIVGAKGPSWPSWHFGCAPRAANRHRTATLGLAFLLCSAPSHPLPNPFKAERFKKDSVVDAVRRGRERGQQGFITSISMILFHKTNPPKLKIIYILDTGNNHNLFD